MKSFQLPAAALKLVERLHSSAGATPYYHLDGYMHRWWIFGDRSPEHNRDRQAGAPEWHGRSGGVLYRWLARRFVIRAHTILRSDRDRHMHDHPSASISIVVDNGYWEVTPHESERTMTAARDKLIATLAASSDVNPDADLVRFAGDFGIHWRAPGAVVLRAATALHSLILPKGVATRSIFIMGPKTNEWGFMTEEGKVPWRSYESARSQGAPKGQPVGRIAQAQAASVRGLGKIDALVRRGVGQSTGAAAGGGR